MNEEKVATTLTMVAKLMRDKKLTDVEAFAVFYQGLLPLAHALNPSKKALLEIIGKDWDANFGKKRWWKR
jgi:hypothetical protein